MFYLSVLISAECTSDEFRCNSGTCILRTFLCDDQSNCEDGEDERVDECQGIK